MIEEEKQLEHPNSSGTGASDMAEDVSEAGRTPTEMDVNENPSDFDSEASTEFAAEAAPEVAEAEAADTTEVMLEESAQEAIDQLAEENETLRLQLEERTNQSVRLAADFDNFRKRTQKDREEQEQLVKRNTLSELLPIVDSFERARSQIKPQTDAEATIHKSYQGVYKQLVDCLKRIGVAPMRPEGKPFDPNLHEAVLREPTDEYPEGTVLEELVRGYLLGDRVLRHSMVKVSTAPEPAVSSEEE